MSSPDATTVHASAIVIDAVCPLLRDPDYVDWWIEGGATAAAPSLASTEGSAEALRTVAAWRRIVREDERLLLVQSAADVEEAKRTGRFGIIFHFQGTDPYEDDLDLVDVFKELGVGIAQLTYNVRNRVGDGCEEPTDSGLSRYGVKLVKRLSRRPDPRGGGDWRADRRCRLPSLRQQPAASDAGRADRPHRLHR